MMGKNQSVGKRHTKWLGGPGWGSRAACCTPLTYTVDESVLCNHFHHGKHAIGFSVFYLFV